jgi:DNA polymerase-3 subunit delta
MLFFLYGEDTFRSYEKVLEIKYKFQMNDKSGSGLSSFDASEKKNILPEIENALGNIGLFSSKKLLIFKKTISESSVEEQTKLLIFFKKNIEKLKVNTDSIVLFWENSIPRKNNALFKFLLENTKKQNFEKLSGTRLEQWILKKIAESQTATSISSSAINKLIAYTNSDLASINQELEKLIAFSCGEIIDDMAIELLVKSNLSGNIFETIDALASKNKKGVLKLIHKHIASGDDPFYLFSMFIYQFRNLLRISSLQESGIFNEFEIARLTKLHPYVIKKSLHQAKILGFLKLKRIYAQLCAIDLKIKTGKIEIGLALDKFISEL